ncbi:hypothetical protein ES703_71789 [subsurface metagenome]
MGKKRVSDGLTIGYEWETLLLDKYGLPLKFDEIEHMQKMGEKYKDYLKL